MRLHAPAVELAGSDRRVEIAPIVLLVDFKRRLEERSAIYAPLATTELVQETLSVMRAWLASMGVVFLRIAHHYVQIVHQVYIPTCLVQHHLHHASSVQQEDTLMRLVRALLRNANFVERVHTRQN